VSVLQVLARRGEAGVTEISHELSVHKSTVSRLLGTLEARGLVEQASSRGRYRLGYGVVLLAEGASSKHDLTLLSRPECSALAEDLGETVNLVVQEADAVLTLDQVIGSATMTTINWVGRRNPLHVTSAGKVFLANMPAAQRQAYLDTSLDRFTEHTVTEPANLEAELATVREQGYALTFEELEVGLAAVAAPILSLDGRIIAAIAVSGPTFRLHEATIPGIAARVITAAARISERNGYPKAG
jgi:DNA-binding IclR family transcriptional regulator